VGEESKPAVAFTRFRFSGGEKAMAGKTTAKVETLGYCPAD